LRGWGYREDGSAAFHAERGWLTRPISWKKLLSLFCLITRLKHALKFGLAILSIHAQLNAFIQYLQGSKHEKFVAGIITHIRTVWIGEFKTMLKTSKFMVGALYFSFYLQIFCVISATTFKNVLSAVANSANNFQALSPVALTIFKRCCRQRLKICRRKNNFVWF
jgi:hypothetical protein